MGFFSKALEQFKEDSGLVKTLKLGYIGGLPKVTGAEVKIKKGPEQNTLDINGNVFKVVAVKWEEKGERSVGKAAAGAIIGGVLTGGVGAIAGAALGGRKKDSSTAAITVKDDAVEYTAYVRCNDKEFKELTELIS